MAAPDKPRQGTLVLVPNALDFGAPELAGLDTHLPLAVIQRAATLTHWVVENAKTARAFLKRVAALAPLAAPLQALAMVELQRTAPGAAEQSRTIARVRTSRALQSMWRTTPPHAVATRSAGTPWRRSIPCGSRPLAARIVGATSTREATPVCTPGSTPGATSTSGTSTISPWCVWPCSTPSWSQNSSP